MEHETFWSLLADPAHWAFELFLIFLFDIVLGLVIWPAIRRMFAHHKSDDTKLAELEERIAKLEKPMDKHFADNVYYHCGICDCYHPANWNGDCRDDANRFAEDELDGKHPEGWNDIQMEDLP